MLLLLVGTASLTLRILWKHIDTSKPCSVWSQEEEFFFSPIVIYLLYRLARTSQIIAYAKKSMICEVMQYID